MDFTTVTSSSQPALTDTTHLRRLDPAFATKTDVTLCTTDGRVQTELRAHAQVLSEHSHVLSEMITACDAARIYMVGDSLTDVQAMLTIVYQPLARSGISKATAMTSHQLLAALAVLHKYAMEKAKSAVELQLIAKVEHAVQRRIVNHDTADSIISCAAAGERFELPRLRAYSEAYIALNLDNLDAGDLPLSTASLCRIATALAKRFKSARDDIDNLVPALEKSMERHAQYEAVIAHTLRVNEGDLPACPRNKCKGCMILSRSASAVGKYAAVRADVNGLGNTCRYCLTLTPRSLSSRDVLMICSSCLGTPDICVDSSLDYFVW